MRRPAWLLLLVLLAPPAEAKERKTIPIRMPRVTLAPGSNVELCYFVRIPATTPFLMGSWQLVNKGAKGGTQLSHALAYLYTGEQLAGFPAEQLLQSRGCLDLGPGDRDDRVLVAGSSAPKVVRLLPSGVGLELAPAPDAPGGAPAAIGILIDVAWVNDEPRPRKVQTKLTLRRVPKGRADRIARPLSDRTADAGIFVPPFSRHATVERVDARWTPATDACVLALTGQMHRRGQCLGIDQLDASGAVKPPSAEFPNPCEPDRRQLFVASDWTDPGALPFNVPLAVRAGESLRYSCWTDNGGPGGAAIRLGCEATPGVTPGEIGVPAAPCTIAVPASSECPGNAACVPANLVAGPDTDDELCGITGFVYDAAPGGSCSVAQ